MILGIDPGIHDTAFAQYWENESHIDTYYFKVKSSYKGYESIAEMCSVIEDKFNWKIWPDIINLEVPEFVGGWTPDANKIMFTAAMAGALANMFSSTKINFLSPHKWKGQIPKHIHQPRLQKFCLENQIEIFPALGPLNHHVWDAIGLALWK